MHSIRSRVKPLDSTRFHILLALAGCQSAHGAAIQAQIIADTVGGLYVRNSSLYVCLKQFQAKGLIEMLPGQEQIYGLEYRLTRAGEERLARELQRFKQVVVLARERQL